MNIQDLRGFDWRIEEVYYIQVDTGTDGVITQLGEWALRLKDGDPRQDKLYDMISLMLKEKSYLSQLRAKYDLLTEAYYKLESEYIDAQDELTDVKHKLDEALKGYGNKRRESD